MVTTLIVGDIVSSLIITQNLIQYMSVARKRGKIVTMRDTKLIADTITELQNEIATQREVICNLNTMNDELQSKLDKIEQIVNDYDTNCGLEEYMYLEQIKEVLE